MDATALKSQAGELVANGEVGAAMDLVAEHWRLWLSGNGVADGLETTAAILAADGPRDARRVRVLYVDGALAFRSGDQVRSRASNDEALALARAIGDGRGQCDALTGLARVALRDGRFGDVIELAKEAEALADAAGDRAWRARPLHLHAAGVRLRGDHAAARELYIESLALARELNDRGGEAMELHNLGWVELHLGNVEEARRRFDEPDGHPTGDEYLAAWRRLNRAALAAARGDRQQALPMYREALRAIRELGVDPDPDDQFELDWLKRIING